MSGRSLWAQRTSDGRVQGRDHLGRFLPRELAELDRTHRWYRSWMTGNLLCEVCRLLPLDADDMSTACPGRRDV